MQTLAAQEIIVKMQAEILKKGISPANLIKEFKTLREYSLTEGDPTVTKVLRLVYEHLEEFKGFFISLPSTDSEELEDDDEGDEIISDGTLDPDVESLNFLLSLLHNSSNKINREDLIKYRDMLVEFYTDNA